MMESKIGSVNFHVSFFNSIFHSSSGPRAAGGGGPGPPPRSRGGAGAQNSNTSDHLYLSIEFNCIIFLRSSD